MRSLKGWLINHIGLLVFGYLILFMITGILTLHYYGLTWDEGLGNLFFGERYLHYFTSFKEVNLDFKSELPYNQQHPLNLYNSPFHEAPQEFPPVADTLSAATMYIFSYDLGWINPVDGFHLFTVLLATVFLGVLYQVAKPRIGKFNAFLAVIFLSLFPRFWGDMHFNVKDVPETIFFGIVILTFITWMEKPSLWKAVLTGIFWGLALGTKANAIFLPIILLIGLVPWGLNANDWHTFWDWIKHHVNGILVMVGVAGVVYIGSWPYLYAHPVNNLKTYWIYILSQGGRSGGTGLNIDPIRQVIFTTPEIMLVALIIGMIFALRRVREPFWRIMIVWLIFPILRASLPGTVNFDGIRHFLEFLPAAAIIAGFGLGHSLEWLSGRGIHAVTARGIALVLLAVQFLVIYPVYFPYLHIYYNQVSGGLAGARYGWLGADAGDYWKSSYRQGMAWLDRNAPPGSIVRGMGAEWIINLSAPVFLRPDLQMLRQENLPDFSILDQSDHPVYLVFVIRNDTSLDELAYCQKRKTPVYQIIVDRVPILQIFRFGKNT